ncbi:cell wall-associated hydrolase [Escherichia coli DEC15D]|nr:cell wall-associated hydrolase [Escherichia coli DEC15D]
MSPEDWLQAKMQGEIVALVHSHPGGLPWLSEADRRLQVQSDLPWWLGLPGGDSQVPLCAASHRAAL